MRYLKNILRSKPIQNMMIPRINREVSIAFYIKDDGNILHNKYYSNIGNKAEVALPSAEEIKKGCEFTGTNKVVVSHNHPSGQAKPSHEDFVATRILGRNLRKLNIYLVDHIIVTTKGYYSFKQNGEL